jgi:hypothetical protein
MTDFPSDPTIGQIWPETGTRQWIYSAGGIWRIVSVPNGGSLEAKGTNGFLITGDDLTPNVDGIELVQEGVANDRPFYTNYGSVLLSKTDFPSTPGHYVHIRWGLPDVSAPGPEVFRWYLESLIIPAGIAPSTPRVGWSGGSTALLPGDVQEWVPLGDADGSPVVGALRVFFNYAAGESIELATAEQLEDAIAGIDIPAGEVSEEFVSERALRHDEEQSLPQLSREMAQRNIRTSEPTIYEQTWNHVDNTAGGEITLIPFFQFADNGRYRLRIRDVVVPDPETPFYILLTSQETNTRFYKLVAPEDFNRTATIVEDAIEILANADMTLDFHIINITTAGSDYPLYIIPFISGSGSFYFEFIKLLD